MKTGEDFVHFFEIIKRLRAPDGCPWDRKQTPLSFRSYLLEETHELYEAIGEGRISEVREELGDLLFQIVLLSIMYAEEGHFTIDEVIAAITAKMVRRHPHVFAGSEPLSDEELRRQWQTIKAGEKKKKEAPANDLHSIPRTLPALFRAQRVTDRAARRGCVTTALPDGGQSPEEILDGLNVALSEGDSESARKQLGHLLLRLADLGRQHGINAEDALQTQIDSFIAHCTTGFYG